jgi:glutamyl/glutaminyl-tRNA synthetase
MSNFNELIKNIRSLLIGPAVSRFAPSPTGYLHAGHVVSCLYVFGITRAVGGQVLVRIEDHDKSRSRDGFDDAIRDDLIWLGLIPDRSPWPGQELGQFEPELRQSLRAGIHTQRLQDLTAKGLTYRCDCSRKGLSHNPDGELFHDGACKNRHVPGDAPHGIRVLMPDRDFVFDDLALGTQQQNPLRQTGDLLARDRTGSWTYQFSCTVDDLDQGVNLIIRGEDLLPSTARQLALREVLKGSDLAPTPLFFHHPLVKDESGKKLGKRFLSTSIRQMRLDGQTPEKVLGFAAFLAGKLDRQVPLDLPTALDLFAR